MCGPSLLDPRGRRAVRRHGDHLTGRVLSRRTRDVDTMLPRRNRQLRDRRVPEILRTNLDVAGLVLGQHIQESERWSLVVDLLAFCLDNRIQQILRRSHMQRRPGWYSELMRLVRAGDGL